MSAWKWTRVYGVVLCVSLLSLGVACGDTEEEDTGGGQDTANNAGNNDVNNDGNNDTNNDVNNDGNNDVNNDGNNDVNNDAPVCGDGVCDDGEDSANCEQDCPAQGPVCGDDVCEEGEDADNCAVDCGPDGPECGNGVCEEGEDTDNCEQDCPADGPECGNGVCEEGEDTNNCAADCPAEGPECGNGVCEEGEDAASCSEDCDGGMMGGLCPPEGPFGNAEGDVAPDVVLMDCDGNPHSVRDLCANKVGWIFEFAAWCPPCRTFARGFESLMADFEGEDLGVLFVISSDEGFSAPDANDCSAIRDAYGITSAPVLYDANGALQREFGVPANDINIIMSEGNVIEFKRQYSARDVPGELRRLLDE